MRRITSPKSVRDLINAERCRNRKFSYAEAVVVAFERVSIRLAHEPFVSVDDDPLARTYGEFRRALITELERSDP